MLKGRCPIRTLMFCITYLNKQLSLIFFKTFVEIVEIVILFPILENLVVQFIPLDKVCFVCSSKMSSRGSATVRTAIYTCRKLLWAPFVFSDFH